MAGDRGSRGASQSVTNETGARTATDVILLWPNSFVVVAERSSNARRTSGR